MAATGFDQVQQLLTHLAQLPAQMEAAAKEQHTQVRIAESQNNLFTQNRVGRRVTAVTYPAAGKTGWISALDPKRGTALGGDRTRFADQADALERSRQHTLEVAKKLSEKLAALEAKRAQAQVDAFLQGM